AAVARERQQRIAHPGGALYDVLGARAGGGGQERDERGQEGERRRLWARSHPTYIAERRRRAQPRTGPRARRGPSDGARLGVRGVLELLEEPRNEEGDLLADVDRLVADPLQRPRRQDHRHRPLAAILVVA